jgi:predicted transcriptional regulator
MSVDVTIRLDDETFRALERLSARTETPRDRLVVEALQDYVEVTKWHLARIEEGVMAADHGDFASEAEVERVRRKFRVA